MYIVLFFFFFFQAEDGIRDDLVTGVQTCALPISRFTSRPLPFQRYRHDFGNPASRDEPFVGAIHEDRQGILWIGTHEALNQIDRKAERYDAFSLTAAGEGCDVTTISGDASRSLWVGASSQ